MSTTTTKMMQRVHGKYVGFDGKSHFKLGRVIEVPAGTPTRKARYSGCVQVLVGDWHTVLA